MFAQELRRRGRRHVLGSSGLHQPENAHEFTPFASRRAADNGRGAEQKLVAMTDEIYQGSLGRPGRHQNLGRSLAKLDASTRRLIQSARGAKPGVAGRVQEAAQRWHSKAGRGASGQRLHRSNALKDFARCVEMFNDLIEALGEVARELNRVTVTQASFTR
jgi:hypothetical protein